MINEKACAHSCSYGRTNKGSRGTRSIVADRDTFRVAAYSVLFTLVMLAVPTIMALLKSWGVW